MTERDDDGRLSKDVIFELLKNRRRREVLKYLLEAEETVTLGELAEQIAAWENNTEVNALNSDQRKRVYVALYQTHLPKMDDAGIVDYDQDRGLISLADNADLLMMYLDSSTHFQRRWDYWYATLSVLGIALISAWMVQLEPLTSLSGTVISIGVLGCFLLLSLLHLYVAHQRREVVGNKLNRIE